MRTLKRRIRIFFAFQAILLFLAGLRGLLDTRYPQYGISPFRHWAFLTGYLLLSLVFTKAWRTTRKVTEFQDAWATAASVISVAAGLYLVWLNHSSLAFAASGLVTIIIGISGYFLFAQGGMPPESEKEPSQEPARALPPT